MIINKLKILILGVKKWIKMIPIVTKNMKIQQLPDGLILTIQRAYIL
jgi:hypothetical protein